MKSKTVTVWRLFLTTYNEWVEDNASHHAAALAFYALFSLAPLLIIAVGIANVFFGQQQIRDQVSGLVLQYIHNEDAAEFVRAILKNFSTPSESGVATLISIFGLFFGATAIFSELRNTLNLIWDSPIRMESGIGRMVLNRVVALSMVIGSGVVLIISILLDTVFSRAMTWVRLLPVSTPYLARSINFLIIFLLTTLIVALIYKYIPDRSIAWGDVWIGALATALLFAVGRYVISVFLGFTSITTPYGAAGSLAILLLWTYFSAQIFFVGAEFTQVYTRTYGTRWEEQDKLEEPADNEESYRGSPPEEDANKRRSFARTRVVTSATRLMVAFGVIGLASAASILREPFRND